jgi:hypothetical protein
MKKFTTLIFMASMGITLWGQSQVPQNSSSPIYYKDGNVGIGTTSPDGKLHLKGGIAIQNPELNYDTHGNAGERAGIIFGTNHAKKNSMFWISPDANIGNRLNIGTGSGYNDTGSLLTIENIGNVGIGTTTPRAKLDVAGTIRATEIKVEAQTADFVFEDNYPLRTLDEVEAFIKENGHLPDFCSAKEMKSSGVNLAEMNKLLLQKIEELTLYAIERDKEVRKMKEDRTREAETREELEAEVKRQKTEIQELNKMNRNTVDRLATIEALLLDDKQQLK